MAKATQQDANILGYNILTPDARDIIRTYHHSISKLLLQADYHI